MTPEQVTALQACAHAAHAGTMTFPQIISQLIHLEVERYHADYSRREITYYLATGESLVVPSAHPAHETDLAFSAEKVEAAVRQSQRNEHAYPDFIRKTMAAGCVGYFVQITGKRVIYFGRTGDSHVEYFPS